MGLTDPAPRSWDGSVAATAGKVTALRSWRPRAADRIEGTKWSLATTKGVKFDIMYGDGSVEIVILNVSVSGDELTVVSDRPGDMEKYRRMRQ